MCGGLAGLTVASGHATIVPSQYHAVLRYSIQYRGYHEGAGIAILWYPQYSCIQYPCILGYMVQCSIYLYPGIHATPGRRVGYY